MLSKFTEISKLQKKDTWSLEENNLFCWTLWMCLNGSSHLKISSIVHWKSKFTTLKMETSQFYSDSFICQVSLLKTTKKSILKSLGILSSTFLKIRTFILKTCLTNVCKTSTKEESHPFPYSMIKYWLNLCLWWHDRKLKDCLMIGWFW